MSKYKINPKHMFSGDLAFLSNMYPCPVSVSIHGEVYIFKSSEAAFQAGKCMKESDIEYLTQLTSGRDAKKFGRNVKLIPNWENYKLEWMRYVCECKFIQNQDLFDQLLETFPLLLVETNTWNDTFWGVCNEIGENHLGKILMDIRDQGLSRNESSSIPNTVFEIPTAVFLDILTGKKNIWVCSDTTNNIFEYGINGFNGTAFYVEDYCHGCRMENIEFEASNYNKTWFASLQDAQNSRKDGRKN